MATRMSLWRLNEDGSASAVEEETLASEEKIESAVEHAPELLGVLIVGRQTLHFRRSKRAAADTGWRTGVRYWIDLWRRRYGFSSG